MELNNNIYRKLFAKMPDAFAYHQVIYDQEGNPVDYQFLEINGAFEQLTGLKREPLVHSELKEEEGELTTAERETIQRHLKVGYRASHYTYDYQHHDKFLQEVEYYPCLWLNP